MWHYATQEDGQRHYFSQGGVLNMGIRHHLSVFVIGLDGKVRKTCAINEPNVLTTHLIDRFHNNVWINTSNATTGGFNNVAVSADTGQTINASQTSLTGEIATNGLTRALAPTRTHSNGTNTSTLEIEFTITTGTVTDVTKSALWDTAPTGGNMGAIRAFASATGALAVGEKLRVIWTITTA